MNQPITFMMFIFTMALDTVTFGNSSSVFNHHILIIYIIVYLYIYRTLPM